MSFFKQETTINKRKLEQLFDRQDLNTSAKIMAENYVDYHNQSIIKEIISGNLEVPDKEIIQIKNVKSKFDIEESIHDKQLRKAEKQKEELQNKLEFLSHSINVIKMKESNKEKRSRYSSLNQSMDGRIHFRSDRSINFKQEMQERERRIEKLKQQARLKQELRQSEKKQQEQRKKFEEQQLKKKQINENIKKIKERMEKREIQAKEGKQKIKELLHKQHLFQKLQKNYQQYQTNLLEQRKRKLSQIRNLHKPIDHQELINHQQQFLEILKQKDQIRQRERKIVAKKTNSYEVPYQSVFYRRIKQKVENTIPVNYEKLKMQKIKNFSEHVKDNFKPEINEEKRKQWEQLRRKEEEYLKQKQEKQKHNLKEKSRQKGLQYLSQLKKLPKTSNSLTKSPKNQTSPRTQYINYLTHSQKPSSNTNPWSKILEAKDDKQKALKIYTIAQKVQQSLKRKQQLTRVLNQNDNQAIDQGYYDMIKAKLQVLDYHI